MVDNCQKKTLKRVGKKKKEVRGLSLCVCVTKTTNKQKRGMFRRVLTRKKKTRRNVAARDAVVNEEASGLVATTDGGEANGNTTIQGGIDRDDNADDVTPTKEPPGIKRTTSSDLLLKAALQDELKKRTLSSKSRARLDMARWKSNAFCVGMESELMMDPFHISGSLRTDPSTGIIGEALGSSTSTADAGEEGPKNFKMKDSATSTVQVPGNAMVAVGIERSDSIPFDEPRDSLSVSNCRDYSELLQHPILGTPKKTSPRNMTRKPSAWETKLDAVHKENHTSSYESILDGPEALRNEEDDLLTKKTAAINTTPQPTHRVLPLTQQPQAQQTNPVNRFHASDGTDESKRNTSNAEHDNEPRVQFEEPTDLTNHCGFCVESSLNWLWGAPADAMNSCGCQNACHCNTSVQYSKSANNSDPVEGRDVDSVGTNSLYGKVVDIDSLIETVDTCSSSEDSTDKNGAYVKNSNVNNNINTGVTRTPLGLHRKLMWIRRRQEIDNVG